MTLDWTIPCAYAPEQKRRFHTAARARLRRLAGLLGLPASSFDLRSNAGGIAVSGEITLHHEQIYIQISQPAFGLGHGILIRTCRDRRDYVGGPNRFAPLALLDDLDDLAMVVRRVLAGTETPLEAA